MILEDVDLFFPRYADPQDNGLILVLEDFINYISHNPHHTLLIGTTRNDAHIDISAKRLFQVNNNNDDDFYDDNNNNGDDGDQYYV